MVGICPWGQIFVTLPTATLQLILGVFIIIFTWMPKIASTGSLQGRFGVIGFIATFVGMFVSATGALAVRILWLAAGNADLL